VPHPIRSLIFVCCVISASLSFAQQQDWLPINPQELQMKEFPAAPGAPAVQLYYAEFRDDEHDDQYVYRRIKILNEKGIEKYADVEIPEDPYETVGNIKARTIHPDGKIIDFNGETFEKTVMKTRDYKFHARTFALPEVTVGSIIEYRYRIALGGWVTTLGYTWELQHDLYTVKERFDIQATTRYVLFEGAMTRHPNDTYGLSYSYSNMPKNIRPKGVGNRVTLEMENVPAFEPEMSMPPEENFKPEVRFFYGGRELQSSNAFWRDYGQEWFTDSEKFIGNHQEIRSLAAELTAGESDPEKKLRKLYARVQQIRNISFERQRSQEEEKKEELKKNENVADVLARGYGKHNEIARLFVALGRAAGVEAAIVRVSSRKTRFFDPLVLSPYQLQDEIVVVKLNGTDAYFDPGTRFCPFGLVRWTKTATQGLRLDKQGGKFIETPAATADKTIIRRVAHVSLDAEGNLKGEIALELHGDAALAPRLEAIQNDDAGRKKDLEDMMKGWLPSTAIVKMKDSNGWEQTEEPLTANFHVEISNYAAVSGKRVLLPAFLFLGSQKDVFEHAERKYPVYFPYATEELDNVIVQVADGLSVESVPGGQDLKLPYSRFISSRSFQGNQFVSKRALVINGIMFEAKQYPELKAFFDKVRATDDEQAVLQKSALNAKTD
jgi:transglutaminase-like putative cysteine protease